MLFSTPGKSTSVASLAKAEATEADEGTENLCALLPLCDHSSLRIQMAVFERAIWYSTVDATAGTMLF